MTARSPGHRVKTRGLWREGGRGVLEEPRCLYLHLEFSLKARSMRDGSRKTE